MTGQCILRFPIYFKMPCENGGQTDTNQYPIALGLLPRKKGKIKIRKYRQLSIECHIGLRELFEPTGSNNNTIHLLLCIFYNNKDLFAKEIFFN